MPSRLGKRPPKVVGGCVVCSGWSPPMRGTSLMIVRCRKSSTTSHPWRHPDPVKTQTSCTTKYIRQCNNK
ncbi:hypothetical protein HanRHA438_Chr08g0332541 [Helianthus annuus]|nr:hypothetical protein HanRHA438_Chr08g0332541 [Helianthus annuus]